MSAAGSTGKAVLTYLINTVFTATGGKSLAQTNKELDTMSKSAITLGRDAFRIASNGLSMFVNGLKEFSKESIKVGADFENAVYVLGSIAGKPVEELGSLSDKARELGASTLYTATEAAQGMQMLARAGLKTGQILGTVNAALEFAGANFIKMDLSTKIVTSAMKQFGLQAGDAERITDTFTIVAQNSLYSVEELATSFRYGGSVAAGFGASIEETAAMLAQFRNLGLEASMAGVRFRQSMLALSAPTFKARKALEKLEIPLEEIHPAIVGLRGAFKRLGEAGLKADDLVPIVNKISAADVAKISSQIYYMSEETENATDEVTRLMNTISEMRGRTAETYATIRESTLSLYKILLSNTQELQISLFNVFSGNYSKDLKDDLAQSGIAFLELKDIILFVNEGVTELTSGVQLFQISLQETLSELITSLGEVSGVADPTDFAATLITVSRNILVITKNLIQMLPTIKAIGQALLYTFSVGIVLKYQLALGKAMPAIIGWATGTGAAAAASVVFSTALLRLGAFISGPIGVAAAIATVTALLKTFNDNLTKGTKNTSGYAVAIRKLREAITQLDIETARSQLSRGITSKGQKDDVNSLMRDLAAAGELTGNLQGSLEGLRNIDPIEALKESGKYLVAEINLNGKIREIVTDTLTLRRLQNIEGAVALATMVDEEGIVHNITQAEKDRLEELQKISEAKQEDRDEVKGFFDDILQANQLYHDAIKTMNQGGTANLTKARGMATTAIEDMDLAIYNLKKSNEELGKEVENNILQFTEFFNLGALRVGNFADLDKKEGSALEDTVEQVEAVFQKYNQTLTKSVKNFEQLRSAITGSTTDTIINGEANKKTKTSVKELNSELKKLLNELKKLKDFRVELRIDSENNIKILREDLTKAGAEAEKLTRKLLDNLDLEIEKTKRVQKLRLKKFQKGGTGGDYRYRPLTEDQQATYEEAMQKKLLDQYKDYLATFETLRLESHAKILKADKDFYQRQREELSRAEMTERELLINDAKKTVEEATKTHREELDKIERIEQAKLELYKKINDEVGNDKRKLALVSLQALNSVEEAQRDLLGVSGEGFTSFVTESVTAFQQYKELLKIITGKGPEAIQEMNKLYTAFDFDKGADESFDVFFERIKDSINLSKEEAKAALDDKELFDKMGLIDLVGLKSFDQLEADLKRADQITKQIVDITYKDLDKIEDEYQKGKLKRKEKFEKEISDLERAEIEKNFKLKSIEAEKQAVQLNRQRAINQASNLDQLLGLDTEYFTQRDELIEKSTKNGLDKNSYYLKLIEEQDKAHADRRLEILRSIYEELNIIDVKHYKEMANIYELNYEQFLDYANKKNEANDNYYNSEVQLAVKSDKFIYQLFSKQFSAFVSNRRERLKLEEEYYSKVAELEKKIAAFELQKKQSNSAVEKERIDVIISRLTAEKQSATLNFNMAKSQTGFLAGAKKGLAYYMMAVEFFHGSVKGLISAFKGAVDFMMNVYSQLQSIISTFTGGFDIDPMSFLTSGTQAIITDMEEAKKALEELEKRYAEGIITAREYQEALAQGVGTSDPERAIVGYLQETVDNALMFIGALEKAIPLLIDRVKQAIPTVLNALKGVLPNVLGFILDYIPFIATQLISFIVSLLPNVITTLSNQIPIIIKNLTSTLSSNLPNIINKLKKGLFNLLDGLTKPAEDGGKSILNNLIELAGDGLIQVLEGAGELLEYLYPVFERLSPLLQQIFSDVVGVFFKEFPKYNKLLSKFLLGVVTGVIQAVIANLVPLLGSIVQVIFQMLHQLTIELAREVLLSIAAAIKDFIFGLADDVKDALGLGKTDEEKEEARESRRQKTKDFFKELGSLTLAQTETYGDTPQAIQAGTNGLMAKFAPGDYVIAAQNPLNVVSQAMDLLSKGTTSAIARGIAPLTSPAMAGSSAMQGTGGYQNVNIRISADGKILDAITVNAMNKGNAPKLKKKIRKASGLKTGFDRGTYNRY